MSEWISVGERLPDESKIVLFCVARHKEVCVGYLHNDAWYDLLNTDVEGDASDEYCTTGWMPLPQHQSIVVGSRDD